MEPAEAFLKSIDARLRAKAMRAIDLLREFGPLVPMPHARKLTGYDLYELRAQLGSNICRLFYFHRAGAVYVITSGYIKKAQRTNRREIERALRLQSEYEEGRDP